MSLVQTLHTTETVKIASTAKYPWWRAAALGALLLLALLLYPFLYRTAPPDTIQDNYVYQPFLRLWIVSFLPYFAACALVLATKPAQGRWRWIEVGIVLAGALILRALLLPLPPGFSRDSWRYLWDARVTLHGFSPYVYRPISAPLAPLVDNVLFPRMRFRASATIYPPGAQAVFLFSYLLAGTNLYVLKGIFLIFDMVTCGALVVYLRRKGIDACRVLIYAWCPLPIIEFAIQGHVDVISLTFSVLALLSFSNRSLRGRVLTGFLLGMAALTKIYPILLLVVIVPDMLREAMERNGAAARMEASEARAGASEAMSQGGGKPRPYPVRIDVALRSMVRAG
ncbi:MAG TPA: glycosyltransferase 87 family protein, partial [Ktedonobacteraceae bacterium]|nr:glycosyltransferase 87 family protein [Ktedonobacteraceae bacterium]